LVLHLAQWRIGALPAVGMWSHRNSAADKIAKDEFASCWLASSLANPRANIE
jgi:hypothetical protein